MPGGDESNKRAKPASPGFGRSVAYDGLVAVREGLRDVGAGLRDVRNGLRSVAHDGLRSVAYDGLGDVRDGLRSVRDGLFIVAAAYVAGNLFRAVAVFLRRRRDD